MLSYLVVVRIFDPMDPGGLVLQIGSSTGLSNGVIGI